MSESSVDSYLNAVEEVARLAGRHAMSYYGRELRVDTKRDGSPVTVADREAERLARDWIETRFPDDGIVGEEFPDVRPNAHRRWIIDPIDGTKSFVRTVPLWGTLVAVAEGDDVLAGCINCPTVNELVVAARGMGAHWNGSSCHVSNTAEIASATILATDDKFTASPHRARAWNHLAARAAVARTWGDCYGYILVATGRAEVMIDDVVSPWDTAALYPVITEAGGVFSNWIGVATAFGGDSIATNAALATTVREILCAT